MDVAGEHQSNLEHDLTMRRLGMDGLPLGEDKADLGDKSSTAQDALAVDKKGLPPGYCGDCYGGVPPPSGCCNTCDDVREAYRSKVRFHCCGRAYELKP